MEPPDRSDVARLDAELKTQSSKLGFPDKSKACWDAANVDDLVAVRSGVAKGSRVGSWINLLITSLQWFFSEEKMVSSSWKQNAMAS